MWALPSLHLKSGAEHRLDWRESDMSTATNFYCAQNPCNRDPSVVQKVASSTRGGKIYTWVRILVVF